MDSNKYTNNISNIKASDELKERIKLSMKKEVEKNSTKEEKKAGGARIKSKLIPIIGALSALACGGVVFAGLSGKLDFFKPDSKEYGVKFSENYSQYEVAVDNMFLENEGSRVELVSTVADEGFVILKFNVKLDSRYEGVPFIGLSFNDDSYIEGNGEYRIDYSENSHWLGGSNYNLIIDGKDYWIRPGSVFTVNEVGNNEYDFYQMWFLSDDVLDGKTDFTVTLDDVLIMVGEDIVKMPGKFDVEINKEKAKENTKTFYGTDAANEVAIEYKNAKIHLNEVNITPLQNIVKVTTFIENATQENISNTLDDDFIGMINYNIVDQNDNWLTRYSVETHREIVYSDGTVEVLENGDFEISRPNDEDATLIITEYIAIEQNDSIKKMRIEAVETMDRNSTSANYIGCFNVDLEKEEATSESEVEVIEGYRDPYQEYYEENEEYEYDGEDVVYLEDEENLVETDVLDEE